MIKTLQTLFFLLILLVASQQVSAQGCVAIRQLGGACTIGSSGMASSSYNLAKGEFQLGTSYRYFKSFRHFVGTVEQVERIEKGTQVINYSHALDLNASYGLSNRWQLNVTAPFVKNERTSLYEHGGKARYSTFSSGLADVRLSANYWIINPEKARKGNIMVGLGVKLPTGDYNAQGDFHNATDASTVEKVLDQSIQPGDGGVGVSLEIQAFTRLFKNVYGFVNGFYMSNPRENNGILVRSTPTKGLEDYSYFACPDQFFVRAGFMASIGHSQKLSFSLAGRYEGVPAFDLIGGSVGYRRPGEVLSVEPGIAFRSGKHTLSAFVPYALVRNRTQSAADKAYEDLYKTPKHGDAAFADYSISVNYAYRLGKHR